MSSSPIFDGMMQNWLRANGFHTPRPMDKAGEATEYTRQNLTAGGVFDLDLRGATAGELDEWCRKVDPDGSKFKFGDKVPPLAHCTLRKGDEVLVTQVHNEDKLMDLVLQFLMS